jgi:hypothetical protein
MACEDPRIFITGKIIISALTLVFSEPNRLKLTFNYLHFVMKIGKELIADYPLALRCPLADIRRRNEFLKRLKLDQYHPDLPNYISLEKLVHPSDKYFSETLCRKYLEDYEKFLKTL